MDIGQVAENITVLGSLTGMFVAGRAAILGVGDYCEADMEYRCWLTPERRQEVGEPRIWEHVVYYFRETVPLMMSLVKPGWLYNVRLDKPIMRYHNMDRQSRRQRMVEATERYHLPIPTEESFRKLGL